MKRVGRFGVRLVGLLAMAAMAAGAAGQVGGVDPGATPGAAVLRQGRQALEAKRYAEAKGIFAGYVRAHPESVEAEMGVADADLGLHEYEAAELAYRRVTAAQPEMWVAHKNLVIVEAALGRWEEFDRERAVLRGARERRAPGISLLESDVIDSFVVNGKRWIVREYFEPMGRSRARLNFEQFSAEGKVEEYLSLESDAAAKALVPGGAVKVGGAAEAPSQDEALALNWYTAKGWGTIARYPAAPPKYEAVRAAVVGWLRRQVREDAHP